MLPTTHISLEVDSPLKVLEGAQSTGSESAHCAHSLQLCPNFWDPTDCSLPGSSAMEFPRQEYWSEKTHFSRGFSPFKDQTHVSSVSYIAGRFVTTEPHWGTQRIRHNLATEQQQSNTAL